MCQTLRIAWHITVYFPEKLTVSVQIRRVIDQEEDHSEVLCKVIMFFYHTC